MSSPSLLAYLLACFLLVSVVSVGCVWTLWHVVDKLSVGLPFGLRGDCSLCLDSVNLHVVDKLWVVPTLRALGLKPSTFVQLSHGAMLGLSSSWDSVRRCRCSRNFKLKPEGDNVYAFLCDFVTLSGRWVAATLHIGKQVGSFCIFWLSLSVVASIERK